MNIFRNFFLNQEFFFSFDPLKLEKNVFFLGFYKNKEDLYKTLKSSPISYIHLKRRFGIIKNEVNTREVPLITINTNIILQRI